MPLLGSSFAILKPAKMQISVKIGVIQFWNAYEFVIISTTRTIFGYVVLHSVLKTFGVGVDIKLFYQSILDKDITSTPLDILQISDIGTMISFVTDFLE